MAQNRQLQYRREFLPLCDVLFNIISLTTYFCDVVFDLATTYALARHQAAPYALFPMSLTLVVVALLVSQAVSLRWYLWGARGKLRRDSATDEHRGSAATETGTSSWTIRSVALLHCAQIGVLWRYFKLFIPVDLTYVKHEVRELCVLRLIHAFCEAAPMLLLQLYFLSIGGGGGGDRDSMTDERADGRSTREADKLTELTAVSAGFSLWSVCWAVASFSKGAARLRNLERLVLTWLGVLAQLAWRLGTVSARIGALVAYASLYGGQWLLVVMALHWFSMLTWLLLTPGGLFHGGERLAFSRKMFLASLLAFLYVFAYVNLHETNHRQKMIIFYTVMFLENCLLVGVWAVGINRSEAQPLGHHPRQMIPVLTLLALFFGGLFFMGIYYRFFHVRRLRYEAGGRMNGNNIATAPTNQEDFIPEEKRNNYSDGKQNSLARNSRKVKLTNGGIPGVFNCRFTNPALTNLNRKKKKPTTFVPTPPPPSLQSPPPPPPPSSASSPPPSSVQRNPTTLGEPAKQWQNGSGGTRQLIPFWKKPLSTDNPWAASRNDIDVTVGSLNVSLIREKLREKKQQQLRELKAIQEEIKEGKLVPPPSASISSFSSSPSVTNQQPPPNMKLHTSPNSPLSGSLASLTELGGCRRGESNGRGGSGCGVGDCVGTGSDAGGGDDEDNDDDRDNDRDDDNDENDNNGVDDCGGGSDDRCVIAGNGSGGGGCDCPGGGCDCEIDGGDDGTGNSNNGNIGVALTSWPPIKMHCLVPPVPSSLYHPVSHPANVWKNTRHRDRADTPEILLAPRCLPHHIPHWTPSGHRLRSSQYGEKESSKGEAEGADEISDIEGSQISLPRSYTLPREFKYNNMNSPFKEQRGPASKLQPSRFYLPSTNSSDGDVDSADNEEETDSELQARSLNAYELYPSEIHRRCFPYENGVDAMVPDNLVANSSTASMASLGCYANNSYGILRPNHLPRIKVKHETKL